MSRRSLVYHIAYPILAFWISGVMHFLIDLSADIPMRDSGAIRFFTIQALGIILEEVVQKADRNVIGNFNQSVLLVWRRCIGYGWVLAFLSWSAPVYIYPTLLRTKRGEQESILPFSVISRIFGPVVRKSI